METADDTLQFAEEDAPTGSDARPWKLLICDDDQEIHTVTELALRGFRLEDRPLQFVHAYTGAEGVEAARSHPDLALILMDVVMESDDAGLRAPCRRSARSSETAVRASCCVPVSRARRRNTMS